jgi:hypothetical protein
LACVDVGVCKREGEGYIYIWRYMYVKRGEGRGEGEYREKRYVGFQSLKVLLVITIRITNRLSSNTY